jgi:cell wall-associated NlpC family hydrolase
MGFSPRIGLTMREDVTYSRGMSAAIRPAKALTRPVWRAGAGCFAAAVLAFAAAGSASAAPDAWTTDPMGRLLQERGLLEQPGPADPVAVPPATPSIATQVRERASEMVVGAMNFLGVPYRRGGNDAETGFDCSGFTKHLFEMTFGLVLPRRVDDQANANGLVKVLRTELQPGDLVFFNTLRRTFSHVGIYVGDGRFIHSPRTGAEVRVEDMRGPYWSKRFTGARRVATEPSDAPSARTAPLDLRTRVATAARPAAPASMRPTAGLAVPATVGPQSNWLP